ncbi:hypothetical protein OIU85_017523 [Salix viminalis]|uniref:Uncharacterized protein n=1 Tax=Salix viminalis TaxID=40686 RepID=A0A9Q0V7I7_SALVM|nr:hypothetical protein OIU85_017523 [Salix viminalis]
MGDGVATTGGVAFDGDGGGQEVDGCRDRGLAGRGEGSGGWGSDGLIGDGGEVTDGIGGSGNNVGGGTGIIGLVEASGGGASSTGGGVEATGGEKTGIVIGSGDRTGVTEGVGVGLESGGIAGGNITTTGDGGEAYGSICGIVGGLVLSIPAGGCDGGRGCEVAAG